MQKWEYRLIQFDPGSITDNTDGSGKRIGSGITDMGQLLNSLGAEGWEYTGDTGHSMSIFKRPKP